MKLFLYFVSFVTLLLALQPIDAQVTANKFELRLGAGFRQISPDALRQWDKPTVQYYESVLGTKIRPQRNYPGNVAFSAAALYNYKTIRFGVESELFYSQGRFAYKDYSGSLVFNGELRALTTSLLVEKDILKSFFRPIIGCGFGLGYKKWTHKEELINSEGEYDNLLTTITAHATDLTINPYAVLCYDAGKIFSIGLTAGYRTDMASLMEGRFKTYYWRYKFKDLKNGNGVKLKADLAGYYIRLFASVKL